MPVSYQVKRSQKRKSLAIQIKQGQVIVYAPVGLAQSVIDQCVTDKQKWILKHLANYDAVIHPTPIVALSTLTILNQQFNVTVLTKQTHSNITQTDDTLLVSISNRVSKIKEKQLSLLSQFCADQLAAYCYDKAHYYARLINKQPRDIKVKLFKRRWGACDNQQRLQFNLQLVLAPTWVVDYVVAHEVAHLKVLNHSTAFWQTVALIYPNYKKAESWLKINGVQLDIFKI